MNYITYSIVLHFILAFILIHHSESSKTIGQQASTTELSLREVGGKPLTPTTPSQTETSTQGAKPRHSAAPEVDLSVYANQLKVLVDPKWVQNSVGFNKRKYSLEVLILVLANGNIKSIKVIKSSGYLDLDETAIATLREVGSFPPPPSAVIKDGLIWEFSNIN